MKRLLMAALWMLLAAPAWGQFAQVWMGPPPNPNCPIPSLGLDKLTPQLYICGLNAQNVPQWQMVGGLDSPGPIGDITPNTGDFTALTANQGLSIPAPAQPYLVLPPDPTGACIYEVNWLPTNAVQLCNLANLPFPLVLNFGFGNYAVFAIRTPVNNTVGSNCFASWVAGNGDFELCGPAAAPSFTEAPMTFAQAVALSGACAAGTEGTSVSISDSTTNTWGATVTGGGANHVGMRCNGTNWTVYAK